MLTRQSSIFYVKTFEQSWGKGEWGVQFDPFRVVFVIKKMAWHF